MPRKPWKFVTLTTGEIIDIKRRVALGESINSVSLSYRKYAVWTILRASRGEYDYKAIQDDRPPLDDKQIQKLLSWPTLRQLENIRH